MTYHHHAAFRSWRRRSGLTQEDVAFLVGLRAASQVSRHESGDREPDLRLALGYKLVFDATVHELLPTIFADVATKIGSRAKMLIEREATMSDTQRSTCKAQHLQQLVERIEAITAAL
jgi:transcriptional regulator with XRE-family HTH domain